MSTILRFFQFLSLGTWVGSILYLSFVVAPGAFATLGSRDLAGAVVGMALSRLHLLGLLARSLSALGSAAALLVVLMLVLTLISQYGVSPRLAALRVEMGSVDATPQDNRLRVQFNRLHRASVQLEVAVLLAGLVALFLTVRERAL